MVSVQPLLISGVHCPFSQSPFSAVMETSVGDNETVLYTCQDSSTGCVQLMNRGKGLGRRGKH